LWVAVGGGEIEFLEDGDPVSDAALTGSPVKDGHEVAEFSEVEVFLFMEFDGKHGGFWWGLL